MFKTDNAINNNIFIYGDIGAGKTYLITEEAKLFLKNNESKLYIIDLYGEYREFAQEYNGKIIDLSPSSNNKVNPFYIENNKNEEIYEDILNDKIDDLCNLFNYNFNHFELQYIKNRLLEIYNKNEEITFSTLLENINRLKEKEELDKVILLKWEYSTMLYSRKYIDNKSNICLDKIDNNLIVFDLSHTTDKDEISILFYSVLYLIWENIKSSKNKNIILIDQVEKLDKGADGLVFEIMKKARYYNNSGVIISTNNYNEISDNNIKKHYCLGTTDRQLIMRINRSISNKIRYDMNLSAYEIAMLEQLKLGEYVQYPRPREEV